MSEPELAPCPFCGARDTWLNNSIGMEWWVVCRRCDCQGPRIKFQSEQQAADYWNTRRLPLIGKVNALNWETVP
jgi:Lar family restriction alleviation protein